MTIVRRVIPLTMRWERLPKSYSVHGDGSGAVLVEPVPAIALDTDDGWALILEYGLGGHPFPEQHGMFRIDYDDPRRSRPSAGSRWSPGTTRRSGPR